MAQQQKHKTHKKPRKLIAKQTDDGMVVFPMANGQLATTWVSNVDAILSEGTGTIDLDRLKVLESKLANAMTLLHNRINELEMDKAEKAAKEYIESKIKYITEQSVGKLVRIAFDQSHYIHVVISYAAIEGTRLHIKGIYPNYMQRNNNKFTSYAHSSVGQYEYNVPLTSVHARDLVGSDHFILSSTTTATFIEFGAVPAQNYFDTIKKFLGEINEQFNNARPKPKKLKLIIKKGKSK